MKTPNMWSFRSIVGKVMMGLVLAAMVGSIDVAPALGRNGPKSMGRHDNGRYEHRGPGYDHNRYQGRPYYRGRGYYAPPPVIYAPPPPPGIGISFPPVYIR